MCPSISQLHEVQICSAPFYPFSCSLIAPCPNQEATSPYEKSLPSYEQIQKQVLSSAPLPATAQPRARSCSQSAVQARAEIHRELGGAGDPLQDLAPRLEPAAGSWYVIPGAWGGTGGMWGENGGIRAPVLEEGEDAEGFLLLSQH